MAVRCKITLSNGASSEVVINAENATEELKIQLRITAALRLAETGIYNFKTLDGVSEALQAEVNEKVAEIGLARTEIQQQKNRL